MSLPFILSVVFWFIFFASHSYLASESVKNWSYQHLGFSKKGYRLAYSVLSTFEFAAIYSIPILFPEKAIFHSPLLLKVLAISLLLFGAFIALLPFRYISASEFIGLKSPSEMNKNVVTPLVVVGIYKWVRHPIYSGLMLVFPAWFVLFPSTYNAIACLMVFLYLPFGIYWEEQKLILHFGKDYLDYKKSVKALIPKIL